MCTYVLESPVRGLVGQLSARIGITPFSVLVE
jgi:hypothetical protein